MTDKANEIRNIRKAQKLFRRAVDMMDGYRVGDDTGTSEAAHQVGDGSGAPGGLPRRTPRPRTSFVASTRTRFRTSVVPLTPWTLPT